MKDFNDAKRDYETVPIPGELDSRVREGIRQGKQRRRRRQLRQGLAAAACFVLLVTGLNLSPTLAKAASEVPVLGPLFRVLTVISYDASDGGINYVVSVPRLEADGALAEKVNAVIQEKVDAHLEQARRDWADYQEAFFATGGTEEEWNGREMEVLVDYEIKSQTDTRLSFTVTLAEGWVSSREERCCYNLDLAENRPLTLRDLLGEDWVSLCNEAVRAGIAASTDSEGFSYFFAPEDGGFVTVDEQTAFYIREDGVPVLVFPEYSIAAGAAGSPEFPVPFS